MSESKENFIPPQDHVETPELAEGSESVVVKRVSTVFTDNALLERLADKLMSQGLTSGYEIQNITSGYLHKGKSVKGDQQFKLEILVENGSAEKIAVIKDIMEQEIGVHWDVAKVVEDEVTVNKSMLGFIRKAEIERQKFIKQKRWTRATALAAMIGIGSTIGVMIKNYTDQQRTRAVAAEKLESLGQLIELNNEIQNQIANTEFKIIHGKEPLNIIQPPADSEFGIGRVEELQKIADTAREALDKAWELLPEEAEEILEERRNSASPKR